jgi:hypothetical protein
MTNFKDIADRAIARAKADIERGYHVISAGTAVKAEGITGYRARQIEGEQVDGKMSALVELQGAMAEIRKHGSKKVNRMRQLTPEAAAEYTRLMKVIDELGLNEDDEEEE